MKKIILILLVVNLASCNSSDDTGNVFEEFTKKEIENLQFLKEEEKLARDVYLFSYDLYHSSIFNNIASSEQTHMNAVSVILNKYNIEDLSFSERGKFSNEILQNLYDDLVSLASQSIDNALIVGATIEDLDINDLNSFIMNTNHNDVVDMYQKLNCGSKNHIRSFTSNLENIDIEYQPQFISLESYDEILNNPKERCN